MEENKLLFLVEKSGDGTNVRFQPNGVDEVFAVALAIFQVFQSAPIVATHVSNLLIMSKDKGFQEALKNATIDIPDFDSILKKEQ